MSPPKLTIVVLVRSTRWQKCPAAAAIVRRSIRAAALALPARATAGSAELTVVLTHDAAIRALNAQWRNKDAPTNVLSFPALPGATPPGAARVLGDIVIAHQTLDREARAMGKPFRHHLAHLAVHGYLHLMGHDHENLRDAHRMESLETKILAGLAVPDPYADTVTRP